MQDILTSVNWLAVIVGAIAAFILGAIWYAPSVFGKKWKEGLGSAAVPNRSLAKILVVQAIGTFLFSWFLVISLGYSMALGVLAAVAIAVLVKANGLFAGNSLYAVSVEAGYVLAQAALIIIAFKLF